MKCQIVTHGGCCSLQYHFAVPDRSDRSDRRSRPAVVHRHLRHDHLGVVAFGDHIDDLIDQTIVLYKWVSAQNKGKPSGIYRKVSLCLLMIRILVLSPILQS